MTYSTKVAPFVGAWIEISVGLVNLIPLPVAPFVGAWIEIIRTMKLMIRLLSSLRSSERGLKLSVWGIVLILGTSLRSSERGLKFLSLAQHFLTG